MKKAVLSALMVLSLFLLKAQKSVVIGVYTEKPHALLVLNPEGRDQGFLAPQLTTQQRLQIKASPNENGLIVFDTETKSFYYWKDTAWIQGLGIPQGSQTLTYNEATHRLSLSGGGEVDLSSLNQLPSFDDNQNLTLLGNTLNIDSGTSVNLNNLVAGGTQISGPLNSLTVIDSSIHTAHIASEAITGSKLATGAVTTAHLASAGNDKVLTTSSSGVVTWSDQNTLPDASVTNEIITGMTLTENALQIIEAGETTTQSLNGLATGGDVTGTIATTIVAKIQGREISSASPADNQILQWDGATSQWTPRTISAVSAADQYYSVDPADFTNLKRNEKRDKDNMVIYEENTTFVTVLKKDEGDGIIAPLHLPHGATISEAVLYYTDNDLGNISVIISGRSFTGEVETLGSWTSSTNVSSIESAFIISAGSSMVIDNSLYTYRIEVRLDQGEDADSISQATHRIYGLRIKYSL